MFTRTMGYADQLAAQCIACAVPLSRNTEIVIRMLLPICVFVFVIYVFLHGRKPCESPVCRLRSLSKCLKIRLKNGKLNEVPEAEWCVLPSAYSYCSSVHALDNGTSVRVLAVWPAGHYLLSFSYSGCLGTYQLFIKLVHLPLCSTVGALCESLA